MKQEENKNIIWSEGYITREQWHERNGHKSCVLWFTGLSGSGKTTIARGVQHYLFQHKYQVTVLDGDNVRHGLNRDLGFTADDRKENLRRVAEVAGLFRDNGFIVMTAFISPYKEERSMARDRIGENDFIEVYVKADLETCKQRDPKGLYKKAIDGEIANFTGITDPFEEPDSPDLIVDTAQFSLNQCITQIAEYIEKKVK